MSKSASLNSIKNDIDAMADNELNITINVGNLENFKLTIDRDSEEFYRLAAKKMDDMWRKLKVSTRKSDEHIFAVIALKFASQLYRTLDDAKRFAHMHNSREAATLKMLDDFESQLNDILLEVK